MWTSRRLVCHYCGSKDLAPSFIKRWDRRCRKCFSKRYGSAARARKAKTKEVALRRGIRDRGLHPNFPPVISRVRRLFRPSWGALFVVLVSCSSQFFRPPFTL